MYRRILLLLFLMIPPASARSPNLIVEGERAFQIQKYDESIHYLEMATQELNRRSRKSRVPLAPYLKLADAYFFGSFEKKGEAQSDQLKKAETLLDSLVKEKAPRILGNPAEVWARLGRLYGQQALMLTVGQRVAYAYKIQEVSTTALKLDPDNPIANAVLGIWHYELSRIPGISRTMGSVIYGKIPEGDIHLAFQHIEKAIHHDPAVVFYHLAMGKIWYALDEFGNASQSFEKAIALPSQVVIDGQNKLEAQDWLEKCRQKERKRAEPSFFRFRD